MDIEELDGAEPARVRELVLACAGVPRWADELVAARPLGSRAALLDAAATRALTWTDAEVARALADHPRIGERPAGPGPGAAASVLEQSGVDHDDAAVAARLAAGNAAYEARFDRVFLVRAAGRSAPEILDVLAQRLQHDPDTERAVVAQALREIALLRLAGAVPA